MYLCFHLPSLLNNAAKFTREGFISLELELRGPPRLGLDWNLHGLRAVPEPVQLFDGPDPEFGLLPTSLTQLSEAPLVGGPVMSVIVFHVRDTGLGLTPEQKARLFQPFVQADVSTTRQFGGSGLGLSICKQLTELWKGEIGVESEGLGKGCHFWVTLPSCSPSAMQGQTDPVLFPEFSRLPKAVAVLDSLPVREKAVRELLLCFSSQVEVFRSVSEIAPARLHEFSVLVVIPESDLELWPQLKAQLSVLFKASPEDFRVVGFVAMSSLQKAEEFFEFPVFPKPPTFAQIVEFLSLGGTPAGQVSRAVPSSSEDAPVVQSRPTKRVLVAEDIKLNQMVVSQMLKKWNIQADIADNGLEAVSKCGLNAYEAVFMDCHMPLCDGFEATRRIRLLAGYGEIPIIALTAATASEDQEACQQCGMSHFLAKPVTMASLQALLVQASII